MMTMPEFNCVELSRSALWRIVPCDTVKNVDRPLETPNQRSKLKWVVLYLTGWMCWRRAPCAPCRWRYWACRRRMCCPWWTWSQRRWSRVHERCLQRSTVRSATVIILIARRSVVNRRCTTSEPHYHIDSNRISMFLLLTLVTCSMFLLLTLVTCFMNLYRPWVLFHC